AQGFARTAAGALVAAVNITARTSWQFGPGVFGPTIEQQVTGPEAMALLQYDEATYERDAGQLPEINVRTQFLAYRMDSYTAGRATVSLVQGATGSGGASICAVTTVSERWLDGDWRVVAPAGGDWTASQIPSPAGYTPFPGR
ncbi:MAG: hypothetical protein J2P25_09700, partial [Nocardiopsaceae bacterium]|nr:hypothetical protein [Nocardiopsaceae bacterium]